MVNCRMRAQDVRVRRPKSAAASPFIEKVRGRPNTAAWITLAITSEIRVAMVASTITRPTTATLPVSRFGRVLRALISRQVSQR